MVTKVFIAKSIVIVLMLLSVSIDAFGMLYVRGSLERTAVPDCEEKLWIKVKQDLIKRKGLVWLMNHPDLVQVFLLNDGSECGLFIWGRDSVVMTEIKTSIDDLSESNETVIVPYASLNFEMTYDGSYNLSFS